MKGIDVIVEQAGSRYQVVVVRVLGQIDTTTSHELERRLQFLLKDRQFDIVIDLSKVSYISSAGWGIFISEIRGIRESGGDLKLAGMTPEVAEVFELLEFHNILESFRTVQEAVERFEKPDPPVGHTEGPGAHDSAAGSANDPVPPRVPTAPEESPVATEDADNSGQEVHDRTPQRDPVASASGVPGSASPERASHDPGPAHAAAGEALGRVPSAASETGVATEVMESLEETAPETSNEMELEIVDPENPDVKQQIRAEIVQEEPPAGEKEPGRSQRPSAEPAGEELVGTGAVSREFESMILEIVREHPEFGCLKIRGELVRRGYRKPINPLSLFTELKRLSLETKEKRRQYVDSF